MIAGNSARPQFLYAGYQLPLPRVGLKVPRRRLCLQFPLSELVTVAGTEYAMQANLSHYEDIAELEDDILCFLPTVSELDVFGCELELLNLQTQQPLPEAFRTELLHRPQLQIVVRPCMVDGHSIWQFQNDGKESYPKAVRVPANEVNLKAILGERHC